MPHSVRDSSLVFASTSTSSVGNLGRSPVTHAMFSERSWERPMPSAKASVLRAVSPLVQSEIISSERHVLHAIDISPAANNGPA